jgi:hypothetical protein
VAIFWRQDLLANVCDESVPASITVHAKNVALPILIFRYAPIALVVFAIPQDEKSVAKPP